MNRLLLLLFFMGTFIQLFSQEYQEYLEPINDPSAEGQRFFVQDLLDIAGYVPENIQIYQTLPNRARVFRVKLDSINGGFVFVRWDKAKKENYVANKMIDPKVYYNLKTAKEIMRQQTDKKEFNIEDGALQAPDQETISSEDLEGLRLEYELQQEEKKLRELEKASKKKKRKKN